MCFLHPRIYLCWIFSFSGCVPVHCWSLFVGISPGTTRFHCQVGEPILNHLPTPRLESCNWVATLHVQKIIQGRFRKIILWPELIAVCINILLLLLLSLFFYPTHACTHMRTNKGIIQFTVYLLTGKNQPSLQWLC